MGYNGYAEGRPLTVWNTNDSLLKQNQYADDQHSVYGVPTDEYGSISVDQNSKDQHNSMNGASISCQKSFNPYTVSVISLKR